MAAQSKKNTAPKREPQETSPRNGDTRVRLMKVAGLILGAFAVFTLVATVSYLFTWQADQSLSTDPDMMSQSTQVSNLGGKLGFRWGRFLVARCFGLGSLAIIILLFAGAIMLFFRKNRWSFAKTLILSLTGAIISSIILSFCASIAGDDTIFEGGLGGDCGALAASWGVNVMGEIVTGLILVIFVVLWLLYASGSFSRWFTTLGEGERKPREKKKKKKEEKEDNEMLEGLDEFGDMVEPLEPGLEELVAATPEEPVAAAPVEPVAAAPETVNLPEEGVTPAVVNEIEVIEGQEISAEVKKELPRIDTREELSKFKFPPLDLLEDYSESIHDVSMQELERNNNKIRATLLNYKIEVEKVSACKGPTVTLYKVTPAPGVKISSIRNLEEDIAMALGSTGVRVVTLPDVVGIEVPNARPSIVPLKSLLNDDSFRHNKYELPVAMGYTITQKVKVFDLADAPHLLIAGATKQGKSVGLNVIIASLLYSKHPSEMKLVFIDPKMVEFNAYAKLLKHYLAVLPTAGNEEEEKAAAIVKHPKEAEETLRSLCVEMDERYELMSSAGVNNVKSYNEKYKDRHLNPQNGHRYLPYIVVVIDEYADLIMSGDGADSKKASKSITNSIVRLAQKGRAAGLHVIIATQRPTVNVITGLIKTNFPMRIAFRTVQRIDSMTILDKPGAERLIGKGDMLFYAGIEMERMQCAMVSMDEITSITDYIGGQTAYKQCYNTPYYLPLPKNEGSSEDGQPLVDMQNVDSLFKEAAEYIVLNQKGSTSLLQRRFGVGFARAGKVMDQLEAAGVVGPQDGSKPREVLVPDLNTLQGIFDAYLK